MHLITFIIYISVLALSRILTTLPRNYRYQPSRSLCSAITAHLAEQVYIACQLLRCVLHLILQLLGLRLAQPFGEPAPYRLKVSGWIVGPNHRKGVGNGGHNGVAVEALEILPRRLAPLDDGV